MNVRQDAELENDTWEETMKELEKVGYGGMIHLLGKGSVLRGDSAFIRVAKPGLLMTAPCAA